jgi:hypothetical protein
MTTEQEQLWRCRDCGTISLEHELLTAPSPFNPADSLVACPECRQCQEGFDPVCDEPGCEEIAEFGWPDGSGQYRFTCSQHVRGRP